MDLKVMPRSYKGYKFILVVIDEVTNFIVTICHLSVRVIRDRKCFDRACFQQV